MTPSIFYQSKKIEGFLLIKPSIHQDYRGENFEGYNKKLYNKLFKELYPHKSINITSMIDSYSISKKNVLRGMHGDNCNWKLIDVLFGSVYFVVIDTRPLSNTYKNIEYVELNDINKLQAFVPSGCVNGHYVLSTSCIFHYKLNKNYININKQIHIKWNAPEYKIDWPTTTPILSERDK